MKNIIVLCDGTGNEISENISNVLKFYRCLRKTPKTLPRQLVFYDPGVGTLARQNPWRKMMQDFDAIFGLATGYGLDDKVLQSYLFLVRNYEPGDQIYLLGFSRGAYTVRVLAGLIHKVGLLAPEQVNLAGSGLTAYKRFGNTPRQSTRNEIGGDRDESAPVNRDDEAAQFARITSTSWPLVRFVGVWDTVASVIVPRPDRFYLPSLEELAFTLGNPSVQTFRHAISIDERRAMFRLKKWDEPQTFAVNRFNDSGATAQDVKQVWFSGAHADVGGGYPESESGLSKFPLLWMIEEAISAGLHFNTRTINQLAWGDPRKGSPFRYVAPDQEAILHNSLRGAWWLLEVLPKSAQYKEWTERHSFLGRYLPLAEPRPIPEGALLHESALLRCGNPKMNYRPVNLPTRFETVPMPTREPQRASVTEDEDE
jgi:uncharacterized protein (DUF2235 family)